MTQTILRRGTACLERIVRRCAAFPEASAGVAAVEFALVLPVMLVMLLGMTEVTSNVNMDRKLTILSRGLADLTARGLAKMTTKEMSDIFSAASAVMQPFDASKVQMVVSSIKVTKVGNAYKGEVQWSCPKNLPKDAGKDDLTKRPAASPYEVPSGFESNPSFILVETAMPYRPIFGYAITGTIIMGETMPWPVRNLDYVVLEGDCPPPTG